MTVLNKSECDQIVEIIEFIIHHNQVSVADVKKKFNLSSEEYDMISDLMMPAIRYSNRVRELETGIRKLIKTYSAKDNLEVDEDDENEVEYNGDADLRAS